MALLPQARVEVVLARLAPSFEIAMNPDRIAASRIAVTAPAAGASGTAGTLDPVAVTGAGGFLGSAYCSHRIAKGLPVRALVRTHERAAADSEAASIARAPAHATSGRAPAVALDLAVAEEDEIAAALAGVRAVVHFAGLAHGNRAGGGSPGASVQVSNVEATARLARAAAAAGVARLVFASSIKVHGEVTAPGRPFREADAPAPRDAYARSKLAAEGILASTATDSGMEVVILRLPMVYGAGARGNFPRLVDAVARGRWLPLASIDNRRSLLSLDNLVTAFDAALATPMGPVSVAVHRVTDADSVSTPQLVRAIAVALGVRARLVPFPPSWLRAAGAVSGRSGMIARLAGSLEADPASFIEWTGWRPQLFAIDAAMVRRAMSPESGRGS